MLGDASSSLQMLGVNFVVKERMDFPLSLTAYWPLSVVDGEVLCEWRERFAIPKVRQEGRETRRRIEQGQVASNYGICRSSIASTDKAVFAEVDVREK